eukprot:390775-Prorocentrum_minimum.AAC.1
MSSHRLRAVCGVGICSRHRTCEVGHKTARTYGFRKSLAGVDDSRVIRWLNKVLTVDSTQCPCRPLVCRLSRPLPVAAIARWRTEATLTVIVLAVSTRQDHLEEQRNLEDQQFSKIKQDMDANDELHHISKMICKMQNDLSQQQVLRLLSMAVPISVSCIYCTPLLMLLFQCVPSQSGRVERTSPVFQGEIPGLNLILTGMPGKAAAQRTGNSNCGGQHTKRNVIINALAS